MGRGILLDSLQIGTYSFVTVMSLISNLLLLGASLCRQPEATSGDYLMAAMAVADLAVGVMLPINLMADFEIFGDGNTFSCILANSLTLSLPCVALYMLVAMTAERCVNIFAPLRAQNFVTRKRVVVVIAVVWIYGIILTLLLPVGCNAVETRQHLGYNTTDCNFAAVAIGPLVAFMLLGNLFPGMLVLLLLNAAIFCVARKTLKRVAAEEMTHSNRERRHEILNYRRQKSRNNAVLFACQFYVLSYLPGGVALCLDYQFFTIYIIEEWRAPFVLYAFGSFMAGFNTVFNPLILIKSNNQYKRWIRNKLSRRKEKISGVRSEGSRQKMFNDDSLKYVTATSAGNISVIKSPAGWIPQT